jgi:DNA-binding protein HU-beta
MAVPITQQGEYRMTKTQTIATLAEKTELTKAQVATFLEELATLSYSEAKNGFTLPGIGKLVLVDRAARMGRNPATGESIHIAAKTVVKFRVAKACKEAVMPA